MHSLCSLQICKEFMEKLRIFSVQFGKAPKVISPVSVTDYKQETCFPFFVNYTLSALTKEKRQGLIIDSATLQSTQWIINAAYNQRSLQSTHLSTARFKHQI
jgi:hypothetical protein